MNVVSAWVSKSMTGAHFSYIAGPKREKHGQIATDDNPRYLGIGVTVDAPK
jgi:hypothetical protein